jgi:hypothetical protein
VEFVQARNLDLNGQVPDASGPRALLRARLGEVCRSAHAEVVAAVSDDTRRLVFSEYRVPAQQENFEVDYLNYS